MTLLRDIIEIPEKVQRGDFVLHLILQGHPAAHGIPELAPVIQKHNNWISGKKFLLLP